MKRTCAPPDPNTRKPNLVLPPKACDAHCHIFGPAAVFPYHPDGPYWPPDAPLADFRELQSVLGTHRAVIVQATCHGPDNRVVLDAIARSEGRYRGVAMVDDGFTAGDYEALHEGGVRGVRFSFARHLSGPPDLSKAERAVPFMKPLGWHLVFHVEAVDVVENAAALRSFGLPVVIDHMARVDPAGGVEQEAFRLLLELLRGEDFWVKISGAERLSAEGPPYDDMVPFAQALIDAAPDRILWGSDWPHPNMDGRMPNDGDLVDLLGRYAPDAAMRERILVDNPARLYGFED